MNKLKSTSNQIYSKLCKENPFSHKGASWGDQQSQYLRFSEISKHLNLDEKTSILEVGCGNAEFYKYLNFIGFRGSYAGFDINDDLLNEAKKLYPNINVANLDILEDEILGEFDYVCISGVFNIDFGQDVKWVEKMLAKSYEIAQKKLIFNAISTYVNFTTEGMFYINPFEISDFIIKNLSPNFTLTHGMPPCNYTISIEKTKDWQSLKCNS